MLLFVVVVVAAAAVAVAVAVVVVVVVARRQGPTLNKQYAYISECELVTLSAPKNRDLFSVPKTGPDHERTQGYHSYQLPPARAPSTSYAKLSLVAADRPLARFFSCVCFPWTGSIQLGGVGAATEDLLDPRF